MFLVMQMLVNYNPDLKALRWLSFFSLFAPGDFVAGSPVWLPMLALALIATALYAAGVVVFDKKDLPL